MTLSSSRQCFIPPLALSTSQRTLVTNRDMFDSSVGCCDVLFFEKERHFNLKAMHFKEFSGVSETTINDSHILALNPVLNSFLIPS
jgi:hypothetical protein